MNIPRSELDEIEQVPEMAGGRSAIAFAIAKKYVVFFGVCAGVAWLFHANGLSWGQGLFLGLLLAWLYDSIRELRWCIERIYYALSDSEEDRLEVSYGFPWGRSALRLRPRRGNGQPRS
jgi:hypothetical protein